MEKKKELENLLVSVSENDDYAFRVFYDLYYRSVFRFAYYFLRNREACGEVVSNVFVAVWKSRVALRRIENIDAYLYVVARNEANRYLKESRTRRRCLSFEEIPISLIDRHSPPPQRRRSRSPVDRGRSRGAGAPSHKRFARTLPHGVPAQPAGGAVVA